ncbi:recombinase family protein [Kribbella sp. NPDC050820]|uniref:recombinase family protein n=1 Tax=Kribbella sp. NPDC050820 TaxID=3155408 RepID=UPI0033D32391
MLIGYARGSTDKQDLEANRRILLELGVTADHVYLDKACSGTTRARPGLDQALVAVRADDTLVTRNSTGSLARCPTPARSATPSPHAPPGSSSAPWSTTPPTR